MSRLVARIRTRLDEVRPTRTPATLHRGRIYTSALIGVALLVALAWINNSGGVAAACLIALVLGLLWVAYAAHRALITPALAIVWWIATAPALGVVSTAGLPNSEVYFAISQATATNVGLGVVVWLAAVLTRAPRPATTVLVCWLLNFVVVLGATYVFPRQAWVAGYVATLAVLVLRAGILVRLRTGRIGRGTVSPDDPDQVAVRAALDQLAPGHSVRYCDGLLDLSGGGGAVVVGPRGTFAVRGLVTSGAVRVISGGTRLADADRRLDPDVHAVARLATRTAALLRTPVQPLLVVAGDDFADGLVRLRVKPARAEQSVDVLVVREDLAAARIGYGHPVLTTGQVNRITRRMLRLPSATMDTGQAAGTVNVRRPLVAPPE